MKAFPELETSRLLLRCFDPSDKEVIQRLCDDKDIASKTLSIRYPFKLDDAVEWLETKLENFEQDKEITWAVCSKNSGTLIGAVGLKLDSDNDSAEMGFWIGRPYWDNGFVTEAGKCVLEFAFDEMKLNRVEGKHMVGNKASGKVLEKLGMKYEGLHRQLIKKWDEFKDVKSYAILRSD